MNEQPAFSSVTTSGEYAQFLAQLDDAAFWDYAVEMSQEHTSDVLLQDSELLFCTLEDVSCLLPLSYLREILSAPRQYTSLPLTPQWMLGVIAWRGETIPVLDLSAYLVQHPAHWHADDTLLITESAHHAVGCLVTTVEAIPTSLLDPETSADQLSTTHKRWYKSLSSDMIMKIYGDLPLLDLARLIADVTQCIERMPSYDE